ncbi:hypothetical protein M434DRAFT_34558 [Hypoxylon sp. CO27-5]|nr:hypothetical protein M434DRAFT_34558 [Hypoxylon sp. CO27-5]
MALGHADDIPERHCENSINKHSCLFYFIVTTRHDYTFRYKFDTVYKVMKSSSARPPTFSLSSLPGKLSNNLPSARDDDIKVGSLASTFYMFSKAKYSSVYFTSSRHLSNDYLEPHHHRVTSLIMSGPGNQALNIDSVVAHHANLEITNRGSDWIMLCAL